MDRRPPAVAIEPFDPRAPMHAAARAEDGLSGVAAGQIEIQRKGTERWQELPTTVDGDRLVAQIDDERYADGTPKRGPPKPHTVRGSCYESLGYPA